MPYVMDWPPKRLLAIAAAAFALLFTAAPAYADSSNASSPCSSLGPITQAFSQFGDNASYALIPGGDFNTEDTSGWTFNNASLVSGGEPWNVSGSSENQSLDIGPGGEAVSPPVCISSLIPDMRFFAQSQNSNGWNTGLRVLAQLSFNGVTTRVPIGALQSGSFQNWEPTNTIMFPALPAGTTVTVQLVFDSGSNANWNIDDVYVDPYAK